MVKGVLQLSFLSESASETTKNYQLLKTNIIVCRTEDTHPSREWETIDFRHSSRSQTYVKPEPETAYLKPVRVAPEPPQLPGLGAGLLDEGPAEVC